ncbi:MAG: hypothetical protein KBB75_02840 [Candidatus Pacebacteria bacterium]|nr:hypothetical protein [Candidatus Paceibacterota bacterium]
MQKNKFITFIKSRWTRILSILFFLFLGGTYLYIFASPPTTVYTPGETLDPNCEPGETNCTVGIYPTYTNANPSTITAGGISSGSTFSAKTFQEMFDLLLYPYVAISSNLSASLSLSGESSREVGDTAPIVLSWSAAKSSTDSNGKSFFIYGASAMFFPSGSSESSGTAPASSITAGSGVASPSGSVTYTAPTSRDTNGGTGTFYYTIYPCSALQTSAGTCTQSDESGAYNTGNPPANPDNVTSGSVTVTYRYPLFYGSSTTAIPDSSIFSSLIKTVALSGRSGIGNTWNTTTSNHYTYFAWPVSYDNTCLYASGGTNVCFNANDANGASVSDFVRYSITYTLPNSATVSYYVYRSANPLSGSNARYYVF